MHKQPIPSSLSRFGSQLERAIARELTQAAPSHEDNAVVPLAAHERPPCAELGDDKRRPGESVRGREGLRRCRADDPSDRDQNC